MAIELKGLTKRSENYSQWYNELVVKADLAEQSAVRGCMVIKPYGYAIWEKMQQTLDKMFKATGVQNAYFPLLIPKSFLCREAEHVEGFAKECAVVTHYRLKNDPNGTGVIVDPEARLEEELIVRPTSETIIWGTYKNWIHSYRDLPLLINQWANVMRWEMRTRMFLRTSEFLWQEGHCAYATPEENEARTVQMINVYADFAEKYMAMPVIKGVKSANERFAGALNTYTIEAMMQDGKALQMGTSHNLSDHFAKAYDIKYLSKDGKLEHCFTTSWGTSTRMIGGLIMVHGDDRGLVLPPRVAPIQLVILPIAMHKAGVIEKADEIYAQLKSAGIRVKVDDSDQTAGWKFNQWEMKGVPVRLEVGPKDIENKQVVLVRRDTHDKYIVPMETLTDTVKKLLDDIHESLYNRALAFREAKTVDATTFEELKNGVNGGFVRAMWCGDRECEDAIKEKTGATTRCMPFEQKHLSDVCVHCGKPAKAMTYFAKSY